MPQNPEKNFQAMEAIQSSFKMCSKHSLNMKGYKGKRSKNLLSLGG